MHIFCISHTIYGFSADTVLKGIKIKDSKRASQHSKRKRDTHTVSLKTTVEYVIFTEHLLYLKYCELYSPDDSNCTQGTLRLTEYVLIISTGVSISMPRARATVQSYLLCWFMYKSLKSTLICAISTKTITTRNIETKWCLCKRI